MRILIALFLAATVRAVAQVPQVPHKMHFADMTLTIRDDARREIQKDVDALWQSPKHFNIKVERAKTYFPVIEKIFAEENVPDDFKYLVIQESALIADAVSVSNAVGFWQFKDFTAMEMGLRVDKEVDERLNIAAASRGAARYFKKNNFYFNNWLYALQAYQMGAGGVMKSVSESQSGARHMEITSKTYWYVKKYLAHKIAFEEAVKGRGQIQVLTYENKTKKLLSEFAKEVSVDETELKNYNKWAKLGIVPDDRVYTILIPVSADASVNLSAMAVANPVLMTDARKNNIPNLSTVSSQQKKTKINGIATVQAIEGDTPAKLAERAGADLSDFLKWNDISISTRIIPGESYMLAKKRSRATEAYHKVTAGEDLWKISQRYAVQLKRLRKYNRLKSDDVEPGTMLWLSAIRPKDSNGQEPIRTVVEVDNTNTFNWSSEVIASSVITPLQEKTVVSPAVASSNYTPDSSMAQPDVGEQQVQMVVKSSEPTSTSKEELPSTKVESYPIKTEHTVSAGETLYGIANQYKVGVMDLVNWNNLDLQAGIKPGQVLKLSDNQIVTPSQQPLITKAAVHEVKPTDTLYSVARKYGVTIKDLMDWNNKKDFSLTVGETLKVAAP
ncbi:MAG: LysM peptidoglycan-binding domain-containing protein [Cyclobacteriaceae bacterium]|nr:LysM peptidoglycan-binding domain-containing protein [Cyclobacteriaceae bacterium]